MNKLKKNAFGKTMQFSTEMFLNMAEKLSFITSFFTGYVFNFLLINFVCKYAMN